MGLFGKTGQCSVCGQNEGSKKLMDGYICKNCMKRTEPFIITLSWKNYTTDRVKHAIAEADRNAQLFHTYHPTKKMENYISFDENHKLWKTVGYRIIFRYEDIVRYDLLEDGVSVTKGGLGSAAIGGVLFGGSGAVAGSIVGKKKTSREIHEFRLKVVTRNEFYPEVFINFLPAGSIKSDGFVYRNYKSAAQSIITELDVIMDSMNQKDAVNNSTEMSGADEIVKYKRLWDDGIITQEEFEAKKRQLLGL